MKMKGMDIQNPDVLRPSGADITNEEDHHGPDDVRVVRRTNLRALAAAWGRKSLADRLGTSTVQLNHIIGKNPVKNLGEKLARKWEEALNLPTGQLDRVNAFTLPQLNRALGVHESAPRNGVDVVTMERFDVFGSMGDGGVPRPDTENVIESIRVPEAWVREKFPNASSPRNLKVITGYGDSMEPNFRHGDPLIVDTGIHDITIDATYVFVFHGEIYIKTVQRLPGGTLKVISVNKTYEPFTIAADQRHAVQVLGRILCAWNFRPL